MSNSQEQMKDIINNLRAGKTDKEVFCKEIQKDVYCLVYPVFGEDFKKVSTRAIIDICTKIDSINVDKNIMRQIATMVSVFMFSLIDSSTINVNDNYEYNFYKIKEDRELFNIIKDCSKIFKNMKAYDSASDNIKSLSRVQTIMMELYGYEMHSVEEIQELLGLDSEYILKIIAMMKETILGRKPKGYAAGAISGEDDKVELDVYAYEGLDLQEADEESFYYEETDDNNSIENKPLGKTDSEETDENDEGVLFEYDEIGYVRDDYEDSYSGKYTLMDRMSEMVGRIFPHVSRNSRRKVVYASLVMALIIVLLAASVFAMAGNRKKKVKKTVDWTPIEYTTRVPKETTTSKEKTSVAETTQRATQGNTESTTEKKKETRAETKVEETTTEKTTEGTTTKPEDGGNNAGEDGNNAGGDGNNAGGDGNNAGGDGNNAGGDGSNTGGDGSGAVGDGSGSGGDGSGAGGDGSGAGGDGSGTGGDGSGTGGDGSGTGGDGSGTGGDGSGAGGDGSGTGGDGSGTGGDGSGTGGDGSGTGGDGSGTGGDGSGTGGDGSGTGGDGSDVVNSGDSTGNNTGADDNAKDN